MGGAGLDGVVPVVLRDDDFDIDRIPVSTIACACLRGVPAATCGGVLSYADGSEAPGCTPGFDGATTCPPELPCLAVHGPGNVGSGFIGCQGLTPNAIDVEIDCNGQVGLEPFPPETTLSESGPPGSAFLTVHGALGTVVGLCSGTAPDYGPDGEFCTDDDPLESIGVPLPIPFVTGRATGLARNVADFPGDDVGPHATVGSPFFCSGGEVSSASGAAMAGVFTACDQPTVNDIVTPILLVGE